MDLTYQVPRDAYIELLADMVRCNDRRPIRVATALLLTVGQMAAVILLCIFRLEASQRPFFLIWSVLLAGVTVLRRRTFRQRAKGTLDRLEYSGQLPADYWKEHRLRKVGQELRLSYGAQRLACPLSGINQVEEKAHGLYLYCGGTIFDIVPESAFSSRQAMLDFAEKLRTMAAHAEPPKPKENGQSLMDGISWKMGEKAFEDGQYLAFRTLYYRYRFLRPATFVRLAVSVAAVISLMNNRSPLNLAVSIVILLLANLENISMIPFVSRLRIRRELGNWNGSSEYHLALHEDTLVYTSDRASVQIPLHKINLCEEIGPYDLIAWNSFPAVVIPREVCRSPEAAALIARITDLYQHQ